MSKWNIRVSLQSLVWIVKCKYTEVCLVEKIFRRFFRQGLQWQENGFAGESEA